MKEKVVTEKIKDRMYEECKIKPTDNKCPKENE